MTNINLGPFEPAICMYSTFSLSNERTSDEYLTGLFKSYSVHGTGYYWDAKEEELRRRA